MKEGDMVLSLMKDRIYKITRIVNWFAVLDSIDGKSQILTSIENVKTLYRKIENKMEHVENKNK